MDAPFLIYVLICGAICAAVANGKKRSAIGWFFFGLLFGLIAVIASLIVSDVGEIERQRNRSRNERRRLRRELDQERTKHEAFRRHSSNRLDAHDRLLDADTRGSPEMVGGPERRPSRLESGAPPPPGRVWFYLLGEKEEGPIPHGDLKRLIEQGALGADTLVWREGLDDWVAAARVRSLRSS